MLDKLIKTSTLAGAFLIFCGVLKLIFFYSAFNIKIIDFLTFSEILTSFLDDINILLLLVGLMIFQSLTVFGLLHWKTNLAWDRLMEQLMTFAYIHKRQYLIFFGSAVLIVSIFLAAEMLGYHYAAIYAILFFTLQFLTIAFLTKDEETGRIDTPDQLALLSGLITVVVGIFLLAQHDIEHVKMDKDIVTVQAKEGIIKCGEGSDTIFLGKTDSYIFFFESLSKKSIVMPMSSIDKIEYN